MQTTTYSGYLMEHYQLNNQRIMFPHTNDMRQLLV
jgi:hypothetical protein